jgi:hypothetical protein
VQTGPEGNTKRLAFYVLFVVANVQIARKTQASWYYLQVQFAHPHSIHFKQSVLYFRHFRCQCHNRLLEMNGMRMCKLDLKVIPRGYIMNVHFVANIDPSKFNKPVFEGILRT